MKRVLAYMAVFLLCILSAVVFLPVTGDEGDALFVYSGAGLKGPMTEIGNLYQNETGTAIEYTFAGSGTLISQMEMTKKGDAFIPGGTPDYSIAVNKSLVEEPQYVAYHVPVIAVQKGNPHNIKSVKDFTQPGLKVALGDVNATAIGRSGEKLFNKLGIAEEIGKNVVMRGSTINEVTMAMEMGEADVSLLTMDQVKSDKIEQVPLPDEESLALIVPIGITTFTTQPEQALDFADYVASDEGKAVFKKHGFPSYPDPVYAGVKP